MYEKCGNCRFSGESVDSGGDRYMDCKRYPPQLVVVSSSGGEFAGMRSAGFTLKARHPQIKDGDWCGEWRQT